MQDPPCHHSGPFLEIPSFQHWQWGDTPAASFLPYYSQACGLWMLKAWRYYRETTAQKSLSLGKLTEDTVLGILVVKVRERPRLKAEGLGLLLGLSLIFLRCDNGTVIIQEDVLVLKRCMMKYLGLKSCACVRVCVCVCVCVCKEGGRKWGERK